MYSYSPKKKKPYSWVIIWSLAIFLLLIIFLFSRFFSSFSLQSDIVVKQGNTFSVFYSDISRWDQFRVKWYIRRNDIDTSRLEIGNYSFSGHYSPSSYVQSILAWSEKTFQRVTILEWRSIYDIDDYLTRQNLIEAWEYIRYVTNTTFIAEMKQKYWFLAIVDTTLPSLEWFLYPDTYFLDEDADVVSSLVRVQLDAFDSKVWQNVEADLDVFYTRLALDFPRVVFSWYDIMRLASVVQKEERITQNQPVIAWIFLRRLDSGMRIDADITLCYGLKQPYSVCTPGYIARYVSDTSNPYNTRRQSGLPPSIIANVPLSAVKSVLLYELSNYLYYLHDSSGRIHYGRDLDEHNRNKQQYLQ